MRSDGPPSYRPGSGAHEPRQGRTPGGRGRPRTRAARRRAAPRRRDRRSPARPRERAAAGRAAGASRELRASRARIVEAGDAERKRLERDLHDGAQQRLVGTLAVASPRAAEHSPTCRLSSAAERELGAAIAELRELAHGIFPAVLADDGLGAAVHALAEEARVPMRIGDLPDGAIRRRWWRPRRTPSSRRPCAPRPAPLRCGRRAPTARSRVEVEAAVTNGLDLVALEDRLGALDGRLDVARDAAGRTKLRAELPCAS